MCDELGWISHDRVMCDTISPFMIMIDYDQLFMVFDCLWSGNDSSWMDMFTEECYTVDDYS